MNEFLRDILLLPPQGSSLAQEVDLLHYFVVGTTMLGSTAVAVVVLYFAVRYREVDTGGIDPSTHEFKMPWTLELTLIGGLFGLFLLWWWIGVRQYTEMREAPEDSIEIYVVAKQWMFKFTYPEGNASISTLYIPAHRPVKLFMTSRDVIHSFYLPDFRVKQDILPGQYTTIWFEALEPGIYTILCAEFCGTGHSTMRGEVVALETSAYEVWLAGERGRPKRSAPQQPLDLVSLGERTAALYGCLRCHTTDGSPHIAPSFGGLYDSTVPLTDGRVVIADGRYITESMMDPLAKIHRGEDPVMPSYQGLLEPADVAAIVEFIRSLRHVERAEARPWDGFRRGNLPPLHPQHPYPPPAADGEPRYPRIDRDGQQENL
jgi:cytochrome c oxidase subunit 2